MIRLNVIREGQGPIVVLSHALGCDLHMWDGVAAQLARTNTVVRYDHRNHGGSEVVAGMFTMDMLAQDAADVIEREAGGQAVHFVGLSMGGMTAQALATKRPDLLASVVIANSASFYPDKAPWKARIDTVLANGIAAIAPGAVARWLTPEFVGTPKGAEAGKALEATLVSTDAAGYAASCEAVANIDFRETNKKIARPVLVIGGTRDEATPMAMSDEMVAAIPGAKLSTIAGAHLSAVELPEEFAKLVAAFHATLR